MGWDQPHIHFDEYEGEKWTAIEHKGPSIAADVGECRIRG